MSTSRELIGRMILEELGEALDSAPETYLGSVVTGVALAVGDHDIRYVGASNEATSGRLTTRVGVFTESTVVTIDAEYSSSDRQPTVTTQVHRRADLERLEITGGTPSIAHSDDIDWPGPFTVRARYRDGLELVIPMSDANTAQKRNAVWNILNGLRQDLTSR